MRGSEVAKAGFDNTLRGLRSAKTRVVVGPPVQLDRCDVRVPPSLRDI